ncbi:MAG: DUF58 domain-containing protein [Planctomycetaceae bacterium]
MHDSLELLHAVNAYRLVIPTQPATGRSGELLGRSAGSSLEFRDYREYAPGDDVRHLDWAAFARSDALMVRLYREEVSPQTEVLLDGSRSMDTNNAKRETARQLAAAFALWSSQVGGVGTVTVLDDSPAIRRIPANEIDRLADCPFDGRAPLNAAVLSGGLALRRQSLRMIVSDFLFDADPQPVIRKCADGAGALWVLQLLTRQEADPSALGGRRLTDLETGDEADLFLNEATISEYRRRLKTLQDDLQAVCRKVRARFVVLIAETGLRELCRSDLCAARMIEPV